MTDITDKINEAVARKAIWTASMAEAVAHRAAAVNGRLSVDWDQGAGEGWVRVLLDGECWMFVRTDAPLVLARTELTGLVDSDTHPTVVSFEKASERSLRASRSAIESLTGRTVSTNVDTESMSPEELWWATV